MSNPVNNGELKSFLNDQATRATTFTGEVFKQLAKVQTDLASSFDKIANALEQDMRFNANLADQYYAKAVISLLTFFE